MDLVQAGNDVEFGGGYVVHVTKREGSSVKGIHILVKSSDGPTTEITADTGTIEPGLPDHSDYENQLIYNKNQVTIVLYNAKNVTGDDASGQAGPKMGMVGEQRSNSCGRPFPRKPSGRRVYCPRQLVRLLVCRAFGPILEVGAGMLVV